MICSQIDNKEPIFASNVNGISDESNNVYFDEEMMIPVMVSTGFDSHTNSFV